MNDKIHRSGMHDDDERRAFVAQVEAALGRTLTADEARLATTLMRDKTARVVARELAGAPITDPKKIRPEHKDAADE